MADSEGVNKRSGSGRKTVVGVTPCGMPFKSVSGRPCANMKGYSCRLRGRVVVCSVLFLCCCRGECSPPTVLQSFLWSAWDETLTLHLQCSQACVCNHKAMEIHMCGKQVA